MKNSKYFLRRYVRTDPNQVKIFSGWHGRSTLRMVYEAARCLLRGEDVMIAQRRKQEP